MTDLNGQVAWVTGAGTGIGEAGAVELADAGCIVVLSGRRREPLEAVADTIRNAGGTVDIEPLDVASQPDVDLNRFS